VEIALYGGARDKNAQTLVLTAFSMLQQSDPGWANPATLRGNKLVAVDHELRPWTLSADTQKKLAKIHQTVLDSNELRGAWVELAECRDHTGQFLCYNIHVHYDIDAPTDAKDKLKAILGADLGQPYVIAREEPLPLSDLASRINSILGLKESMDGCVIQGCCFFPLPSDGMTVPRAQMIVFGRIADEEQRAALTKTVKTIVEYDPDLQTHLANFDIRTDGLQVVPPNSLRGERQFNLGLRHFWNNDYAEAVSGHAGCCGTAAQSQFREFQAPVYVIATHPRRHSFGPGDS
jgi:hypothetical protein